MRPLICLLLLIGFLVQSSFAGIIRQDVRHLNAQGSSQLIGDVALVAGTGITITQGGQNITVSSSGGSSTLAIATKSAAYSMTNSDDVILVNAANGPVTITMQAIASATIKPYRIKKIDTSMNDVSITSTGGDSAFDGVTTEPLLMNIQNQSTVIIPNGSAWYVF